jgi:hypothetical protein
MDITITIRIDTGDGTTTVSADTGNRGVTPATSGTGEPAETPTVTGTGGRDVEAPSADLLARAQAIGASNAGPAPRTAPSEAGPPVFTGSTPPATLDEASYEEGLPSGPVDVSAGAAPGMAGLQDPTGVTEAVPTAEEHTAASHETGEDQPD